VIPPEREKSRDDRSRKVPRLQQANEHPHLHRPFVASSQPLLPQASSSSRRPAGKETGTAGVGSEGGDADTEPRPVLALDRGRVAILRRCLREAGGDTESGRRITAMRVRFRGALQHNLDFATNTLPSERTQIRQPDRIDDVVSGEGRELDEGTRARGRREGCWIRYRWQRPDRARARTSRPRLSSSATRMGGGNENAHITPRIIGAPGDGSQRAEPGSAVTGKAT
jgi:hypothetical protein